MNTQAQIEAYERLLRKDAEAFAMTVSVYAELVGRDPREVALTAITDAYARLNEQGALGEGYDD